CSSAARRGIFWHARAVGWSRRPTTTRRGASCAPACRPRRATVLRKGFRKSPAARPAWWRSTRHRPDLIPPAPAAIIAVPRGKRMPVFFKDTATEQGLPETDGLTLIDRDVTLVGEIVSEENIRLRGRIEGNVVTSGSVVIEPHRSEEHTSELQSRVDLVC